MMLRDMVNAFQDLRVILMSATVDTTVFAEYFGSTQIVEIHGRVHPVQSELFFQRLVVDLCVALSPDYRKRFFAEICHVN